MVWYPIDSVPNPVFAGISVGSAWPLAGTGCQYDGPSPGWTTTPRPRMVSVVLMVVLLRIARLERQGPSPGPLCGSHFTDSSPRAPGPQPRPALRLALHDSS